MKKLPRKLPYDLHQTQWADTIDPVITNVLNSASLLQNVSLASGANTISHKLGQKLQGWYIVRQNASAQIYDQQDTNQHPELTLILNASAPVTVSLAVF